MATYKSNAQERWAHTEEGTKALGGKKRIHELDVASKGAKLPKKVGDPKPTPVPQKSNPKKK